MNFTKQDYRISRKEIGQLEDNPITKHRVDYIRDRNNKLLPLK